MYSNVHGDFVATPVVGTKRITFSDFANNVISGDLSVLNFIKAEIYEVLAIGTAVKLPTTTINYSSEQGLTLLDMVGNFKEGDQVAVYIEGRDKGFDEENDAYKIVSSEGGGEPQEVTVISDPGEFYLAESLKLSDVVIASPSLFLRCTGRLDKDADTGDHFLQIYDSASVPADGAVTIIHCMKIEHINGYSDEIHIDYPRGKLAASGISYALSSSEFTKTEAVGQTFLALEFEFKEVA